MPSAYRRLTNRTRRIIDETLAMVRRGFEDDRDIARRQIELTALEQRLLMSATPVAVVAEDASATQDSQVPETAEFVATNPDVEVDVQDSGAAAVAESESIPEQAAQIQLTELVVIDPSVGNYEQLFRDLEAASDRDFEILLLNPREDGIAQITNALSNLRDVAAIHLVSHAEDGELLLGTSVLSQSSLSRYAPELLSWNASLTENVDLLVYGCDLSTTENGRQLLDSLHSLLGADIAASDDTTGHDDFGGDWNLEYEIGEVETDVVFSAELQQSWLGKLNSITVTTTADVVDAGDGLTSLREAIIQTNAGAGGDTIILAAGTYTLSRNGAGEDLAATGDLDISKSVSIVGSGAGTTIIDASGFGASPDRVFHINGSITVSMEGITITGGGGQEGAGVLIDGGATVNIRESAIVANDSGGNDGGGVYINAGTVTMTDVTIADNAATGKAGGGIFNHGVLTLDRVTISGNTAKDGGGLQSRTGSSSLLMTNVTVSGNTATGKGGGIETNRDITIMNSTIAFNKGANGGGINDTGGTVTVVNSIFAGNTLLDGTTPDNVVGNLISNGHNIDSDGTAGLSGTGDLSNVDPLLAPLANNGGFVQTHALLAGSAAIDGGIATGAPRRDARGILHDATVDIGAFAAVGMTTTGEIPVNQTTGNVQVTSGETRGSQQAIAVDGAGNYVVVWSTNQPTGSDANGWAVMARLYSATGTPISDEFLVNQTTVGDQQWARVARADDGTFVVTWTSGTPGSEDVYFRRFAADGTTLTAELRANDTTTNSQKNSVIAMDRATGDFVIAWQGEGPGDTASIFFRRFNADGTAKDATDRLATPTGVGSEIDPAIAMQTGGAFVIGWIRTNDTSVRFQRFEAGGGLVGGDQQIDNLLSNSSGIDVAADAAGNFTFAYRENGIATGVWRRGYNADGTQRYTWSQLASGDANSPSITMFGDGSHIVTWQASGDADGTAVYGRRYNADGSANGAVFQVNATEAGHQSAPSVAALSSDNYVVAWSGQGTGDTDGVFVRQYGTAAFTTSPTADAGGPYSISEGQSVTLDGTGSSDADGDTLSYKWDLDNDGIYGETNEPTTATATVTASVLQSFGLTAGSHTIGLQVNDGHGGVSTATASLQILGPPVATNDSITTNHATTISADLVINDTDSNSSGLNVLDVSDPSHGSVVINADGTVAYTPDTGFSGSDSFDYIVTDGHDGLAHYWSLSGNANDSVGNADGTLHNGVGTVDGAYGNGLHFDEVDDYVSIPGVTYNNEFTVSFRFKVDDNTGSDYIYLYGHDDASAGDSLNVFIGEASKTGFAGVMKTVFGDSNDTYYLNDLNFNVGSIFGDGQWHTYTLTVDATSGAKVYFDGVLKASNAAAGGDPFTPDGDLYLGSNFVADPARLFGGDMDSVAIYNRSLSASEVTTLSSGVSPGNATDTGTVSVTVLNAAPTADAGGPYTISEGDSLNLDAGGSSDPNTDPLTYRWDLDNDGSFGETGEPTTETATVTWATLSSFGITGDGTYTIGVQVNDGNGGIDTATTTLTVVGLPVANNDSAVTPSGVSVVTDVLSNDLDPQGSGLKVLDVSAPTNGRVVINNDGTVTYTSTAGFAGVDSFDYVVSDQRDGLTHYWNLNGNANDSIGGANGTLHNGVATVDGAYGNALYFDEVDDYVEVPDFSYNNEFTVAFKFKVDDNVGSNYIYLYSHGPATAANSLNIFIGESAQGSYANELKTVFGDVNDPYDPWPAGIDVSGIIGDGQWHDYVLTVDAVNGLQVFLDGVLGQSNSAIGGDAFNPSGSLFLGAREDLNTGRLFGGGLDSVAIYDRSLSASEVTTLSSGVFPGNATDTGTVSVTVLNDPPTANAGGPYSIAEGGSLTLDGTGSSDPESSPLTYEWDLNYNGTFSADVTGATPTVNWSTLQSFGIDDNGSYQIALRVNDGTDNSTIVQQTLTVTNSAPILSVAGNSTATSGVAYTLNLSATDAGDDTISQWFVNWGDGSTEMITGTAASATHTYTNSGFTNSITVVAIDEDGSWTSSDMYVTSHQTNQLYRINGITGTVTSAAAFTNPAAMALGPDGLLYVTEYSSTDIDRYDPTTGAFVDTFVYGGSGGLNHPSRLAFGPDGDLYVTSEGSDQVLKYSGSDGRFLGVFVAAGSGGLTSPDGVAFGPDGNLYVSSSVDGVIRKYNGQTGAFISVFAGFGTSTYSELQFAPNGNLYASSTALNVIREFDAATGAMVRNIISAGTGGMVSAGGFSIRADGSLVVADFGGDRVLHFSSTGTFLGELAGVAAGMDAPIDVIETAALRVKVNTPPAPVADTYTVAEGGTLSVTSPSNWFNSNWSTRTSIVFDNAAQSGSLTDVAVLVKLHASAADAINIDYSKTQNLGQDLRFTDVGGNLLAYEIEKWNESGYSYVWVKVPSITAGSTTDSIWMYYGNADASDAGQHNAVWTTNDAGVLHLNANSVDSTSYHNHAAITLAGGVPTVTTSAGIIANAAVFNGSTSALVVGSDASVDNIFSGGGTISAWINPTGWGQNGYGRIADKASTTFPGGANGDGWAWHVAGSGSSGYLWLEQGFSGGLGEWRTATGSINLNTWQNVVITYDNSSAANTPKIYINGVQQSVTQVSTPSGTARSDAAMNLVVGNHWVGQNRAFAGSIDEFRVIRDTLSASEIAAEYAMVNGTFASAGVTETGPGGVLANDVDGDSHPLTVSLVSGPSHAAGGSFTLNSDGSFSYTHDGSETTSDSFTYSVSDGFAVTQAVVTISITAVNDNSPVITVGQSFTVSEAAASGTVVGTVAATDADAGTTFQNWTITAGNDDGIFAVNSSTGQITIADPTALNYDTATSHSLTLTVSDGIHTSSSQAVTIQVTDANNNSPVITAGQTFTVSESATAGTGIGTVAATDTDSGTVFQLWTIVSGNGAGIFAINPSSGQLSINAPTNLDFESQTSYTLSLTVSDGTNVSAATTVTIDVTNVNEHTPVVTAGQIFTIAENSANNTSLGSLSATDNDSGTTLSNWTIVGGNPGGAFGIDPSTGQLTVANGSLLDYETATSWTLNVTVSDGTYTSAAQSVTVNISDVNDQTPAITAGQSFTVSESAAAGASIGTVAATDADTSTTFSGWAIVGGNSAGIFGINATTGELQVADNANLDFETITSYSLLLTVTDGVHTSAAQTVTVNVTNSNDSAPVITTGQTFSVSEAAGNGTSLGTVVATDADGSTTFSGWTIVGGNSAGIFSINATTGELQVANNANLDFETTTSYSLSLTVTDGVHTSAAQTVTIAVTDSNDNPPVIDPAQTFSVSEVAANGTVVGTVTATDADPGTTFSNWTIVGGTGASALGINSTTGQLFVANSSLIDFESATSLTVTLTVSDGTNTSSTWTGTVNVLDANDERPVIAAGQSFIVSETATTGTSVGSVNATDADANTTFSDWTIVSGNSGSAFGINATTGQIFVNNPTAIDFESAASFSLEVRVSDGIQTSATATVTISVTDQNDNAPVINAGQTFSVTETASASDVVGTVVATDADAGTVFSSWDIVSGNSGGVFGINASTGEIFVANAANLDFETTTVYALQLQVTDGTNTSAVRTVTVNVNDANDNVPTIDAGQIFTISDSAAGGTAVGQVTARDADQGTIINGWQIVSGNDDGIFSINSATGRITVADSTHLDFATASSHTLTLIVTDGTFTSNSQTVTVNVLDANNNAPVVTPGLTFSLSESSSAGTVVGTLTATDADSGTILRNWQILSGNTDGAFELDNDTGELRVNRRSAIDFEQRTSFTLTVKVSDGVHNSAPETVQISILPENDNSPVFTNSGIISVPENTTAVTTLSATDADTPGQTITFSITGGADAGFFQLVNGDQLIFITAPDFESPSDDNHNNFYSVQVTADDNAGRTTTRTLLVSVTDRNDNTPIVQSSAFTLSDVLTSGSTIGTVRATDADTNSVFQSWAIVSGNDAQFFAINPFTGVLKLTSTGAESMTQPGVYQLQVTVSDGLHTSAAGVIAITVEATALAATPPSTSAGSGSESTTSGDSSSTTGSGSSDSGDSTSEGSGDAVTTAPAPLAASGPALTTSGSGESATAQVMGGRSGDDDSSDLAALFFATNDGNAQSDKEVFARVVIETSRQDLVSANDLSIVGANGFETFHSGNPTGESSLLSFEVQQLITTFSEGGDTFIALDNLKRDVQADLRFDDAVIGSVATVGTSITVGYIMWAIRGGVLLSGLLAQMPVWTMIDPLLVVDGFNQNEEEGDSIGDIVDKQQVPPTTENSGSVDQAGG